MSADAALEARLLAHKRAVDAERKAQAILRRRLVTREAMARLLGAPVRQTP
jgi:hypothetical protein